MVQTFLIDKARLANKPFLWTGYKIVTLASTSMQIQRSYQLPRQFLYLFLMTLCIKAGEHLGMLTPTVVHAARPNLAWFLGITVTP